MWRDPLVTWQDRPLSLGTPNQGFYYPDPMGFWAEVRKWAVELFRLRHPRWGATEALALTTLLPAASHPDRVARAVDAFEPRLVLFLDEPSWAASRASEAPSRSPTTSPTPTGPSRSTRGSGPSGPTGWWWASRPSTRPPTTSTGATTSWGSCGRRRCLLRRKAELHRQPLGHQRPHQPHEHVPVGGVGA